MTRRPETRWSSLWPGSLPPGHLLDLDDADNEAEELAARIFKHRDPLAALRSNDRP